MKNISLETVFIAIGAMAMGIRIPFYFSNADAPEWLKIIFGLLLLGFVGVGAAIIIRDVYGWRK